MGAVKGFWLVILSIVALLFCWPLLLIGFFLARWWIVGGLAAAFALAIFLYWSEESQRRQVMALWRERVRKETEEYQQRKAKEGLV